MHLSKTLILIYINPAALYKLEALCMEGSDITALDKYQCGLLRQNQSLIESTAISAIHLLLGIPRVQAQIQ